MRKEFVLPETDTEYLDSLSYPWEALKSDGNWVIIHDYPVPMGYNVETVSLGLRIDPGYPNSQIDMVYFSPHLHRSDGKPIGALALQVLDGIQWQRWSRHRTSTNPWQSGIDDISTHLLLINYWLEREFQIR